MNLGFIFIFIANVSFLGYKGEKGFIFFNEREFFFIIDMVFIRRIFEKDF